MLLMIIKINKTQGKKPAKTKELMHNTVTLCMLTDAQPIPKQKSALSR